MFSEPDCSSASVGSLKTPYESACSIRLDVRKRLSEVGFPSFRISGLPEIRNIESESTKLILHYVLVSESSLSDMFDFCIAPDAKHRESGNVKLRHAGIACLFARLL